MEALTTLIGGPEPWTIDWFFSTPLFLIGICGVLIAGGALFVSLLNYRRVRDDAHRKDWNEQIAEYHKVIDVAEIVLEVRDSFMSTINGKVYEFDFLPLTKKRAYGIKLEHSPEFVPNSRRMDLLFSILRTIEQIVDEAAIRNDASFPNALEPPIFDPHAQEQAKTISENALKHTKKIIDEVRRAARDAPKRLPYNRSLHRRLDAMDAYIALHHHDAS